MNKQVEFNIRTLKNKQNGGGLFDGNYGLQAQQYYNLIKGCESIHEKDLNKILTTKEIKARNVHQTISLICDGNIIHQSKDQLRFIDQNMASINSQYLEVTTNRNDEALSNQASSQTKNRVPSNMPGGKPAHQSGLNTKNPSDIVNLVFKNEDTPTSPRIPENTSPVQIKNSNVQIGESADEYIQSPQNHQTQLGKLIKDRSIAQQVGVLQDPKKIQARARASEMSQSLKLLKHEIPSTVANQILKPLKLQSNIVQATSHFPSKKVIQRETSQEIQVTTFDNSIENNVDFVKLIQNKQDPDLIKEYNDILKDSRINEDSVYEETVSSPLNQNGRGYQVPSLQNILQEPTESQKKFLESEKVKFEKFKERIKQKQYITPQQLMQGNTKNQEKPNSYGNKQSSNQDAAEGKGLLSKPKMKNQQCILENLSKFEDKLQKDAKKESALMGSDQSKNPDPSALTLIVQNQSQHNGSDGISDMADKEKSFRFGCDSVSKAKGVHTTNISQSQLNRQKNAKDQGSVVHTISKSLAQSRQNIDIKDAQNLGIQDKDLTDIMQQIINKDVNVKKIFGQSIRQQNESTISKASMNAFNQQNRLESPRYNFEPQMAAEQSPATAKNSNTKDDNEKTRTFNQSYDRAANSTAKFKNDNKKSPPPTTVDDKGIQKKTKIAITSKKSFRGNDVLPEIKNANDSLGKSGLNMKTVDMGQPRGSYEFRDQLIMSQKWIGKDDQISHDLMKILTPQQIQNAAFNLHTISALNKLKFGKSQHKKPSNSGGFLNNYQRKFMPGEQQTEKKRYKSKVHKLAKNQLSRIFNETISPRFQESLKKSGKNSFMTDQFGRITTNVFGLQDASRNRHKFLSMSIDSFDSQTKSVIESKMASVTDMTEQQSTVNNFGKVTGKAFQRGKQFESQFCQSVNTDQNSIIGSSYGGSKWAELTATCNINSYGSKKNQLWIDYVPTTSKAMISRDALDGSMGKLSNLVNIRNINTCEGNVTRNKKTKFNAINYELQRRLINSQEGEILNIEDSSQFLPRHSLITDLQQLDQEKEVKVRNQRFNGRSMVVTEIHKNEDGSSSPRRLNEKNQTHDAFLKSSNKKQQQQQKGERAGALKQIRRLTTVAQRDPTSNQYTNLNDTSGLSREIGSNEQNQDSSYAFDDSNELYSPYQTFSNEKNRLFISNLQKLGKDLEAQHQYRNAERTNLGTQELDNYNRDLGSEIINQYKKARASLTDGCVNGKQQNLTSYQPGSAINPYNIKVGNESLSASVNFNVIDHSSSQHSEEHKSAAQHTCLPPLPYEIELELQKMKEQQVGFGIPDDSKNSYDESKDNYYGLQIGSHRGPSSKPDDKGEKEISLEQSVGLNEIDEKSQINEITTSDVLSNQQEAQPSIPSQNRVYSKDLSQRPTRRPDFDFRKSLNEQAQRMSMSFEEVNMDTLNPKNHQQYQEVLNAFSGFQDINNDDRNKSPTANKQHSAAFTTGQAFVMHGEEYQLKETSMQTDLTPMQKYINGDINNKSKLQKIGKLQNEQLIMIRASPRSKMSNHHREETPSYESDNNLTTSHDRTYTGQQRRNIKSVKITKKGRQQAKIIGSPKDKEAAKIEKQRNYVEPQYNGMPATQNLKFDPSQVIMAQTCRQPVDYSQFRNFRGNQTMATREGSTSKKRQMATKTEQSMQQRSPVAYIGKMKHYENPNVLFQLNQRQMQGRIQNLGANYAQKIISSRQSTSPSKVNYPFSKASKTKGGQKFQMVDSMQSLMKMENSSKSPKKSRGSPINKTFNDIQKNDLNFIDFNCLEVQGQQKKTTEKQNKNKLKGMSKKILGQSQYDRFKGLQRNLNNASSERRDVNFANISKSIGTSFNETQRPNLTSLKDNSLFIEESGVNTVRSGFEFIGDQHPRYNSKVVIQSSTNNMWQLNHL